jgi:hypothetical protein
MGCQCTKKSENSNLNLQDEPERDPQINTVDDSNEYVKINLT